MWLALHRPITFSRSMAMSKDNTLDERIEKILNEFADKHYIEGGWEDDDVEVIYGVPAATEAIKSLIAEERRKAKIEVIENLKFTLDRLDDELTELDSNED